MISKETQANDSRELEMRNISKVESLRSLALQGISKHSIEQAENELNRRFLLSQQK